MKIFLNPIQNCSNRTAKQLYKNNSYIKNNYSIDVFIKNTQSPSFGSGGLGNFREIYALLEEELDQYCLNAPQLSLSKIRTIVKSHCPDIEVDDLSNLSSNALISPATAAYFKCEIPFIMNNNKLQIPNKLNQVIYLKMPEDQSEKDRTIFLSRIMHEITHALQENSSDRISKADYMRKYLSRSSKSSEEKIRTISIANQASKYAYNNIVNLCAKELNKSDNMPLSVIMNSAGYLDSFYNKACSKKAGAAIDNLLTSILEAFKRQGSYDTQTALDLIAMTAEREQEAYRNEYEILKKYANIKGNADIDIIPMSFGVLSDIAKDLY